MEGSIKMPLPEQTEEIIELAKQSRKNISSGEDAFVEEPVLEEEEYV